MRILTIICSVLFFLPTMAHTYYSQFEQDKFIHEEYFPDLKNGVFVEVGAHNGITFSNTYFFEKELGWTGICVEPIPEVFAQLRQNRTCKCIQGCIANSPKDALMFRAASQAIPTEMLSGLVRTYEPSLFQNLSAQVNQSKGQLQILTVNCFRLNDILHCNNLKHVNYLSIDALGAEEEILQSIDFDNVQIDVITVADFHKDHKVVKFLEDKGFQSVRRMSDDILFVNKNFKPKKSGSKAT